MDHRAIVGFFAKCQHGYTHVDGNKDDYVFSLNINNLIDYYCNQIKT